MEHHQEVHTAKETSHVKGPQTAVAPTLSTKPKLAAATQAIFVIYGATVPVPEVVISVPVLTVSALSYVGNYPATEGEPTNWFMSQDEAQQEPPSIPAPPSLLALSGLASTVINDPKTKLLAWSPAAAVER